MPVSKHVDDKMSFWFRVPLTKQIKRDSAGHGEATINNTATIGGTCFSYKINGLNCLNTFLRSGCSLF